ncbi:MAG: 2Fe-2S iron-sulfur cluster-binding protein, partial [bacterium]
MGLGHEHFSPCRRDLASNRIIPRLYCHCNPDIMVVGEDAMMSPEDREVVPIKANDTVYQVRRGKLLLTTLLQARVRQMHLCSGRGLCSTCRVVVEDGAENLSPMGTKELVSLRAHGSFSSRVRLACQARVHGPVQV